MDEELFTDQYDRHIQETPSEVRAFLWSKAFDVLVKKLAEFHKLTSAQRDILKQAIFDTLIQMNSSQETADILVKNADIHPSIVEQIMVDINALFIEPSIQETELTLAEQEENDIPEEIVEPLLDIPMPQAPKETTTSLLGSRLIAQAPVAPIERDHTIEKIESESFTSPSMPIPQAPRDSIDPYRELPNK